MVVRSCRWCLLSCSCHRLDSALVALLLAGCSVDGWLVGWNRTSRMGGCSFC